MYVNIDKVLSKLEQNGYTISNFEQQNNNGVLWSFNIKNLDCKVTVYDSNPDMPNTNIQGNISNDDKYHIKKMIDDTKIKNLKVDTDIIEEQYMEWAAKYQGEKVGVWYAPVLKKLGYTLEKIDFPYDQRIVNNFFEYDSFDLFLPIYKSFFKEKDEDIKRIISGVNVWYPRDERYKIKLFTANIAKKEYDEGTRSRETNLGGIPNLGSLLRSYLKFLYFNHNSSSDQKIAMPQVKHKQEESLSNDKIKLNDLPTLELERIELYNIKRFREETIFEFGELNKINTISGHNGSGKTTIMEAIMLVEKVYFLSIIEERNIYFNSIALEFYEMFNEKDSFIKLFFNSELFEEPQEIRLESSDENEQDFYSIHYSSKELEKLIVQSWNIKNPKNVFVYLPTNKSVIEKDYTFDNVILNNEKKYSSVLEAVLDPKNTYSHLYDLIFNDYITDRVIPRKPPRLSYFNNTKEAFQELIPHLEIDNFSTKEVEGQISLFIKSPWGKFDIRKLSAGEQLIWYSLIFIYYIGEDNTIIIDEPENHLHESLLLKYVDFLKNRIKVRNVLLLTHSKKLIYSSFNDGSNYLFDDENKLIKLDTHFENELRKVGISSINEKMLFVEGITEKEHLKSLEQKYGITIYELNNCEDIIRTCGVMSSMDKLLYNPCFVFMIDRDTKTDEDIKKLMETDVEYYDTHFIVLEKHEIENYLLDEKCFCKVYNDIEKNLSGESPNFITDEDISKIFKEEADKYVSNAKSKFIDFRLNEMLGKIARISKYKEVKHKIENSDTGSGLREYILELKETINDQLNNIDELILNEVEKTYISNWESDWKDLSPGKDVYNQSVNKIAKKLGVTREKFVKNILQELYVNEESELNLLKKEILVKFEKQIK
ncbi:AAA family ATPase [Enterococcus sp. CWB-B31]|uniref:AAA family ATPase n=1 Tax=Enterococcus sp. CWB-B31 TaxID=2885159 RepID=UPI001E2BDCD8|nr:AAA family ATPase [Enterococcus sp. CWB-B31]MCB5953715.1 AAA family ATPase [Enterococcus sp. CWB-B31]